MEKKRKRLFFCGIGFILAFILWTVLVRLIDVQPIGPKESSVGFATLNGYFHSLTGTNMLLYTVTDWLGLVPIGVALGFAILGLVQWIKRKNPLKVDRSILSLGVFYTVVIAVYILFELIVINYRPVLINGYLEASYPSSTTMLVTTVMTSAAVQLRARIKSTKLRRFVIIVIYAFIMLMVIVRIASGVHWITDIIGGLLFSLGVVIIYKVKG